MNHDEALAIVEEMERTEVAFQNAARRIYCTDRDDIRIEDGEIERDDDKELGGAWVMASVWIPDAAIEPEDKE